MNPSNPQLGTTVSHPRKRHLRLQNFIRDIIREDLKTNKFAGKVQTRFPPEPNGPF